MNLAIVDISTKNHVSLINNWLRVASYNGWIAEIYVSSDVLSNIDKTLIKSVNINEFKGRVAFNFLKKIKDDYKRGKIDKVIITSLQSDYFSFWFSRVLKTNSLLTVHNLNAWNGICSNVSIKYVFKSWVRQLLFRQASAFVVSSPNLLVKMRRDFGVTKDIEIMPFKMIKDHFSSWERKFVVYPGIVSLDRKNYETFLALCLEFKNVDFVLLGRASDLKSDQALSKFRALDNVVTFDSYISQTEFNYYIERAAIIFGDLKVDYESDEYMEVYGESKDTGLSYFIVESRVPLMINKEFNNISNLDPMTYYYDSIEGASELFCQLLCEKIEYTIENFPDYQLEILAEKLKNISLK